MEDLFSSGRIVDIILAILAIEVLTLSIWRAKSGIQRRAATLVIAALPGAFLLLALRAALSGAGWRWMLLWLAASFPAHLADLWRRRP
jgi:hypothetical protein